MFNSVQVIGNLGGNPEKRSFDSGAELARFTLYVNERYKSDGQTQERVHRFSVETWGNTADYVAKYLSTGSRVAVSGFLAEKVWTADGQKHSKVIIKANHIENLTPKKANATPTPEGNEPAEDMEF